MICVLMVGLTVSAQNNCSGYRGFADLGYTIGIGDYEFNRFEISTTHGYQVCQYFFVGAGVGFHFMSKYDTAGMKYALDSRESKVSIPLFVDLHSQFMKTKFAPYVDFKLGHFITDGDGFYSNISAGVRMKTIGYQALTLSVGYTFEKLKFETFDSFTNPGINMDYSRSARMLDTEGVSVKVGYEF